MCPRSSKSAQFPTVLELRERLLSSQVLYHLLAFHNCPNGHSVSERRLHLTDIEPQPPGVNSPLGIGRATAHQFAQNGAKAVYICDFDDNYLGYHERQIKSLYPAVEVHTRKFDAADEEAVKEVVDNALSRYGRLDVMFANAGIIGDPVIFSETSKEDFMNVLRVNTLGPFLAAKHAARAMAKTSPEKKAPAGSIIMTASVAGIRSNAGPTPYSASKSAVINMATTMAYRESALCLCLRYAFDFS